MAQDRIWNYSVNIYPLKTWTKTQFEMYTGNTDSQGFTWISLGKQQWGKSSSSNSSGSTSNATEITLPLSMSSSTYSVVLGQYAAPDTWSTNVSISSASKFKIIRNYSPGAAWVAVGKQCNGDYA